MNKTLREISFLLAAGMILAGTCTLAPAQQPDPTLVVPFGRNKELAPAHDVYKFPYKENYIMLPLTNGTMVTEDGGMRVIVNKPVQLNKRRATVIPLGHGAPNISPTPIVPQGFNGGSVPQPVNRPEGVVVRRIYPQQEFITTAESAPVGQTYEVPPVVERTEALPSVVLPENSNPVVSPEHSIVYPNQAAPSETTLSTSVDGTQTTPSPYETSTPSPYTTAPSEYGTPSGTTTPSEYGTPSGTTAPSEYGTPSGTTTPSEYGTPSGTTAPSEYGTPSGTTAPSEYGTPSGTTTPSEYGTPSGTTTPSEYGTPSGTTTPSESGTPSGTTTPSEYGTPSETSTPSESGTPSETTTPSESETPSDPYQPDYSTETTQESEAPTSAWRSTTSNPAETYDSGVVAESPMIMTRQESGRAANPWESQSVKPQVGETVPTSQPAQTSQSSGPQNSASAPSGQTRYVEVRPRRQSVNRASQTLNSGTSPAPQTTPQPSTQPAPQYQPPREVPDQLPPPDPEKQTPKPSSDGRKV